MRCAGIPAYGVQRVNHRYLVYSMKNSFSVRYYNDVTRELNIIITNSNIYIDIYIYLCIYMYIYVYIYIYIYVYIHKPTFAA